MHLDLKHSRLYLCVVEYVPDHGGAHIALADVPHETLSHEFLHRTPSLLHAYVILQHAWLVCKVPPRWISFLERHEFLSDREVDQVEVQVVQAKV